MIRLEMKSQIPKNFVKIIFICKIIYYIQQFVYNFICYFIKFKIKYLYMIRYDKNYF